MLSKMQVAWLGMLSVALWVAATAYIKVLPGFFTDPVAGSVGFATTLPIAWLSVWLIRRIARLSADQLLPGVALVGATAMMIDGVALKWFPFVYGANPVVRPGAAWLLWGYGVSLAIALLYDGRRRSASRPAPLI